ncbi:MAG: hypothetical protein H7X99_03185 [Saprospiraceae bacterium]|nr:hypothetical protein [Saprospiraceae bacterium]
MKKIAVIDLGSNTFHLLIVNVTKDRIFETECRERVFTGLSDGGIHKIKKEKLKYGLDTLTKFKQILDHHQVKNLRIVGTEVLRKAINRHEFIAKAEEILGAEIEIIEGYAEATYIYKGIMLQKQMRMGTHLIMDIGGGSTEFILIHDGDKIWAQSYTLGVGVLHEMFHHEEPMGRPSIYNLQNHIEHTIGDMLDLMQGYKVDSIIGASGSFEVLQSMSGKITDETQISEISMPEFSAIYQKIINADFKERENLKGLPAERVKLIVVGMVLKKVITDYINPTRIMVSPFSLKEGVLSEMM